MSYPVRFVLVAFVCLLFVAACSSDKEPESSVANAIPTDQETAAVAQETPAHEPEAAEMSEDDSPSAQAESEQPAGTKEEPAATVPTEVSPEPEDAQPDAPEDEAPEAETAQPDAPEESPSSNVVVPSGPVRVEPTKEGLTYIGAKRCAMCHKPQHASWLETEHAKLDPPLDCESCHGPGSEYKSKKIMEDPAAARAAGLVVPTSEFCATCHVAGWEDNMLQRAHAHTSSEGE